MKKRHGISVIQNEQWEWVASYRGFSCKGSSEQGAVAKLAHEIIDALEDDLENMMIEMGRQNNLFPTIDMKQFIRECHSTAREKGFWDSPRNIGELLMLIVSELGEALEANRKKGVCDDNVEISLDDPDFKEKFEKYYKDTFNDEIADTFIRLGDLCGGLNIDIVKHIKMKMAYNKTREKLHGKKY